jgi:hypothetical protein
MLIATQRGEYRSKVATAINILREPLPDTILGRKHFDLTPLPQGRRQSIEGCPVRVVPIKQCPGRWESHDTLTG